MLLQRRTELRSPRSSRRRQSEQGLPTGRVEAVARTVTAIGQALDEAAKFIRRQFSKIKKTGVPVAKLCSGSLDARQFESSSSTSGSASSSNELGSALDRWAQLARIEQ